MWHHFINLLLRIMQGMPLLVSSNWAAWILGLSLFVLYESAVLWRRGWQDMKNRWTENVLMGLGVTIVGYVILFTWSVIRTTYDDHRDSTGRWQAVVNEKNSLKAMLQRKDDYIKTIEGRSCPICPAKEARTTPISVKPTVKAFSRDLGVDKDGVFISEVTLSSDVAISPPLTIELDFDTQIYHLEARQLPAPATILIGGDKWEGTHGSVSIPNTGLNPNLLWIVTVKSKSKAHLISPPRLRVGY